MKPPASKSRHSEGGGAGARDAAEALAIAALAFLAAEPERLGAFLALTGIGPGSIRAAAKEPHFHAGVLDHITSDERLLLDFAEHLGIDAFNVTRARQTLAGAPSDVP